MALNVRAYAQRTFDWVDTLELRERLLILAATIVVLYLAIDALGLQPTLKAQQVAEQKMSSLEIKLGALDDQANLVRYRSTDDSLRELREFRDQLAAELSELDANILGQLGALVEPTQAANVLEQVVSRHPGLKMKSLQATSAPLDQTNIAHEHIAGLSQYQLEFELEGGYLDMLNYLQALESMPWKFFWQTVEFEVAEYPRAVTRLQLYTLGAAHNG